jgi:hypothetical protein
MAFFLQILFIFRPDPRIVVGFWGLLLLPGFLLVTIWTGIRVLIFCARLRRAEAEMVASKRLPDGLPRPPRGQGICQKCHGAFDDLYYLPSGDKLCAKCYGVPDAPR